MRDQHIDVAVVVEVRGGDTHAIATRAETRLLGDVVEPQSTHGRHVTEETGTALAAPDIPPSKNHPLQHEEVQLAVAVVVEQADARADDLGKIELAAHP